MKTRFIMAMMISVVFVLIGQNLYNKDEQFTAVKIIGLANMIFFGCLLLVGLYASIKKAAVKQ